MDSSEKILAIDIGGSHIKTTILDHLGNITIDYKSLVTPSPATPANVIATIHQLVDGFPAFDKISTGFPGFVKNGVVKTAPNLGTDLWHDTDLAAILTTQLKKPARVINDADLLGLGVVKGQGLEMMITLGTGFGTAMFRDGILLPHLELAHLPVTKEEDYDAYVGERTRKDIGNKKWNKRVAKVLGIFQIVFNYDTLYLGGGNSSKIEFELPSNVKSVNNIDGIHGGARLWEQ